MSYKEEFKIYCSTIAGEAGGSSDEAIRTVARSIITRIGFREWTSHTNAFEVIKHSGYDAYTDRSSSPNYKVVYNAMSSGKLDNLSKRIIELVEPIYNQGIPDETGMISLYYSPKAQTALHKKNPRKYKERPPWDFSQLERVYINGTNKDDFNWYRYKGDGSTIKISLLNIVSSPVSGKKITVKVTDRLGKYFVKEYVTNSESKIPDIHARKKSTVELFVDETSCKTNINADGKPKKVTLKDYECKFNTTTIPHTTIAPTSPATNSSQSENSQGVKDNEQTTKTNNSLDEVTFNIKLVEGDTGKPLPNTTYHLEYKNNIKPHKTDSSGIESGITADVSQSISVYLDDDDGKKQSIYSMAFPVTGDLNGQIKVLKVPVVSFSIKFVDNNNQPIPRYEFKTLYRGRKSAIKRANRQGISTIKALAGQKLTVIDGQDIAQTTAIVTYGSKQWTMIIGTDITEEDISDTSDTLSQEASATPKTSKQEDKLKPQTEQNPVIKVEKPKVTEVEKKTETGPMLEVASDEAKITIKFVDEATNKPLSGLSYITQSTKYGKNTSVTGKDGSRGRTHDSLVGIDITVLVYEDGKNVEKDVITASTDRNDIPYIYKAKKPEIPNIEVKFKTKRTNVVTEKSKNILRELASQYGMKTIYITSTLRTPEEQARAMYNNIANGRVIRYAAPGAEVTRICQNGIKKGLGKTKTINNMVSKILEYDKKGVRVSKHCVSFETYAKKNIIDLGVNSNGFTSNAQKRKFQEICDLALNQGKLSSFISPLRDKAEPAFHLEIPQ
ncbi:hypothetical protein [Psychrobacter faecalis]|uniref:hypothetical protein n=1 Tax=Psychrobacter faecalis TaxID=180588 RepID=UPI003FD1C68C